MNDPFVLMLAEDDPIPRLNALRASDPVHLVDPLGFWLVTRHDDIKQLFLDTDNVTHDKRAWEFYMAPPEGSMRRWAEDKGIFAVGKDEHARIRRLVAAAFTPRAILRMEQQIREVIHRIAAPLKNREGEVIDILGEFTNVVPNAVISRITGVMPGDDEARFCKIAQAVVQGFLPFTSEEIQIEAERGFREFSVWIRAMIAERRAHPEEDLVSDLIRAQDAEDALPKSELSKDELSRDKLSEDDIVLLLASLIGAGSEATALVSTSVVRTLLNKPDILARLRNDRPRIRRSIDEILRYSFSQPAGTMRFAVRDFELRGKQIRKGQMLMLSGGGANRDPDVFENPDVLDLDRGGRNILTFGNGAHYCLGVHLAREEISSMIEALLDVMPPGSAVCAELIEYRDMGIFRQAINLPVRLGPSN
jgi:cytochrome P450